MKPGFGPPTLRPTRGCSAERQSSKTYVCGESSPSIKHSQTRWQRCWAWVAHFLALYFLARLFLTRRYCRNRYFVETKQPMGKPKDINRDSNLTFSTTGFVKRTGHVHHFGSPGALFHTGKISHIFPTRLRYLCPQSSKSSS